MYDHVLYSYIPVENSIPTDNVPFGHVPFGNCEKCHSQLEKWLLNSNRGYCMMCGMAAYNKSPKKYMNRKFIEKKNIWKK